MTTFTDQTIDQLATDIDKALGKKDPNAAGIVLELQRQNKQLAEDLAAAQSGETATFASYWRHVRQPGNCIIHVKPTQAEWDGVSMVAYTSAEQLDQTVALAIKRTAQAAQQ